nr:immunoglobulin light chain junction region [Macaca mulatta]MPO04237.1 immunoglobulin light chain junction region [Macaca mulatta]MPO04868.1 immunoglobulin light chain junction region [Macaca mulatta]MPO05185.1 immunoglobulin light chain junction region [Macaca mulatta]MPO06484.1 immunoglobulin light chain junction region [Macaca mulatta]
CSAWDSSLSSRLF